MLWWLSFCDAGRPRGEQFLGVAVVRADAFALAVAEAWRIGCNPGGEVEGAQVPPQIEKFFEEGDVGRLMRREECERLDFEVGAKARGDSR